MKYILKNIKTFILNEKIIFNLMINCIFFSSIIMLFSFGLFHEFYETSMEETYGTTEIVIVFEENIISKKDLMAMLKTMDSHILENIMIVPTGFFPKDDRLSENWFYFSFYVKNGKITVAEEIYDNLIGSQLWMQGHYFTNEEYQNGDLVAIAGYQYGTNDEKNYQYGFNKQLVEVDGKIYQFIGQQLATQTPWIPFSTVSDDFLIYELSFVTSKNMTKSEYTAIVNAVYNNLGDSVNIPEYPIPSVEDKSIYYSILIICIMITVVTAIIIAVLYQHIILMRKRTLGIFRLTGLSICKARRMYIAECMLLSGICYVLALFIFHFVLLPKLSAQYTYFINAYTVKNYFLYTALYTTVIYCVLKIMICVNVKKTMWR